MGSFHCILFDYCPEWCTFWFMKVKEFLILILSSTSIKKKKKNGLTGFRQNWSLKLGYGFPTLYSISFGPVLCFLRKFHQAGSDKSHFRCRRKPVKPDQFFCMFTCRKVILYSIYSVFRKSKFKEKYGVKVTKTHSRQFT